MSNVDSAVQELMDKLEEARRDAEKFDAGNDSAGTRLRVALQDVVASCKTIRAEVLATRKERKGAK